jgi:hypothetical protein
MKTKRTHFQYALVVHYVLMKLKVMQNQDLKYLCSTYGQQCALRLPTFPNLDCDVVVLRSLNADEPFAELHRKNCTRRPYMRLCATEHHNLLKPPHLGLLTKDILKAIGAGNTA